MIPISDIVTADLSRFGWREIEKAKDLLTALTEQDFPKEFYDGGVNITFNRMSGEVFFSNSEYQECMLNGDKLENFFYTPYNGHEGFADELIDWFLDRPEDWHIEDVEYLADYKVLDKECAETYINLPKDIQTMIYKLSSNEDFDFDEIMTEIMDLQKEAEDITKEDINEITGENYITVLVVEPMKIPYTKDIQSKLESLQEVVGGRIEPVYSYVDNVALVCNEEGKNLSLQLNRGLRDEKDKLFDVIAGTFFICGLKEDGFTSIPTEMIDKYKKEFLYPESFVRIDKDLIAERHKTDEVKKELKSLSPNKKDDKNEPEL